MESVFTFIYENKIWGNNENIEYKGSSGAGSQLHYNMYSYIPFLKQYILNNNIKSIVDLGCGDFICGKSIYEDLDVLYTGYDVYKNVVLSNTNNIKDPKYTFKHLDFFNNKEEIIPADLCILKDVIQHWSLCDIYTFLDYLVESKKFKYILICNCSYQNVDDTDICTGNFRPLNCDFLPLKKYNAERVFVYNTKEVSVIKV